MNGIWQGITQIGTPASPVLWPVVLAQRPPAPLIPPAGSVRLFGDLVIDAYIVNLIVAILILVIGWIIAAFVANITQSLLKRTDLDNRLAASILGRPEAAQTLPVEQWIATAVFWLIMLFVLVAFLEALKLTAVSQPLYYFLNQILGFLPRVGSAALLLAGAWVLATLTKLVVTRTLRTLQIDQRLGEQVGTTTGRTTGRTTGGTPVPPPVPPASQYPLSETIGNVLYWFIFLLFLPSILSTLELQGTLQPVQELLNKILSILPNIFAAVLIGATGWFIAQVVRRIVTNLLAATGTDQLGTRFGISQATGGQTLSGLIGTIVYVFILIPTAIAALQALQIEAISAPAISMLTQILNTIPQILTAGVILAIAYFIGKFVADLVTNILTSIGFNNIFYWLGLQPKPFVRTPVVEPLSGEPTVLQTPARAPTRTPSEIAGIVVLVGIMLVATVAATDVLKIPALTAIVTGIAVILGRILAGLLVFAIGLYLANLAFNLITSSGTRQSRILGHTARIAVITLVSAMALQQMGIASDIVNLAFGLLLGAIAVAIALAFGLGSRDIAAQQVREWLASFRDDKPPRL